MERLKHRVQTAWQALMTDDRNLTSHTYNKEIADRLFTRIPNYAKLLNVWIIRMQTNLKN